MPEHLETLREREDRLNDERTRAFQQYVLAVLMGGVLMYVVFLLGLVL